ncbi:hypothetical protein G8C15_06135 [Enterococcus casseliflavus]|nr:hypothetical protein [Enterococcus casseliflavus]MBF0015403.1 hypothetical protein [Enterococcus casseliflavus]
MKKILFNSLIFAFLSITFIGMTIDAQASVKDIQNQNETTNDVNQAVQEIEKIIDFYNWALHSRYDYDIVYNVSGGQIVGVDDDYQRAKKYINNFYSTGSRLDAYEASIYAWDMIVGINRNANLRLVINNTAGYVIDIYADLDKLSELNELI